MREFDMQEPSGNSGIHFVDPAQLYRIADELLFKGIGAFRLPSADTALAYVGDLSNTPINSPLFVAENTTFTLNVDEEYPGYEIESALQLTTEEKAQPGRGFYDFQRIRLLHEIITDRGINSAMEIFPNNTKLYLFGGGNREITVDFGIPTVASLDEEEKERLRDARNNKEMDRIRDDFANIKAHGFEKQGIGLHMVREYETSQFTEKNMLRDLAFYEEMYNLMYGLLHEERGVPSSIVPIYLRTPNHFTRWDQNDLDSVE